MEEIIRRTKIKLYLFYGIENVSDKDAVAFYLFGWKAKFLQARLGQ